MIVTVPGTGFLATSQLTLVKGAKADRSVCSTGSRGEPRTNAISELLFDKLSKTSGMRFALKAPTALGYYHFCFCENKIGGGCQSDDFSRHMATISVVGPTPTLLTTSITVMANSEFNLTVEGSLKAGDRLCLLQLNESLSGGSQGSCSERIPAVRPQGPVLPSGVRAIDTFSFPSGTARRTTPLMTLQLK
jgi:hypothetical protein